MFILKQFINNYSNDYSLVKSISNKIPVLFQDVQFNSTKIIYANTVAKAESAILFKHISHVLTQDS